MTFKKGDEIIYFRDNEWRLAKVIALSNSFHKMVWIRENGGNKLLEAVSSIIPVNKLTKMIYGLDKS